MILYFLSAFVFGILGSFHCMGMCGPLVMSLPFQTLQGKRSFFGILAYHFGKMLMYALFGFAVGLLGQSIAIFKYQQVLTILAGIVLLVITVLPTIKQHFKFNLPIAQSLQWLNQKVSKDNWFLYYALFGFINGMFPCGLMYAALATSAASLSAWKGFFFMFFFGLGTVPSLSFVIYFQKKLSPNYRKYFTKSTYYFSILVAALLILRGFNLGIPYVSPKINTETKTVDCCHRR